MRRLLLLALIPMLLGGAAITNSAFAHNDICHTLGTCPPDPTPPPCVLGTTDHNPTNADVAPSLGQVVIPRRSDGKIPIGFNDQTPRLPTNHAAYTTNDKLADLIKKVGGEGAMGRWGLTWAIIEPTRNAAYDWTQFDQMYCAQVAKGIKPIMGIGEIPGWADAYPDAGCVNNCLVPPAEQYFADYRDILEAAVIRYPEAAAWGVWNEPNLVEFWGSTPDPAYYAKLTREAYKAVKNGNPGKKVIAGSLSNKTSTDASGMRMGEFLAAFLDAQLDDGTKGKDWLESVAFHPYPHHVYTHPWQHFDGVQPTNPNVNSVGIVRDAVAAAYPTGPRPRLIVDEVGVYGYQLRTRPSDGSGEPQRLSQADQDATMQYVFNTLNSSSDFDAMIVHTTSEPFTCCYPPANPDTYGWTYKDGLGRYMPKLVYCSFASSHGTPVNCNNPV